MWEPFLARGEPDLACELWFADSRYRLLDESSHGEPANIQSHCHICHPPAQPPTERHRVSESGETCRGLITQATHGILRNS